MKTFRIAGTIAAAAAGLLIVAVGILYALFDGEKIKAELSAQVYAKTQRKLVIDGAVSLSVWPDVALRLPHLMLSERGSDAAFAALDSARVAVAVMPLLSKRVDVRRVELDGLALTLVKHKDGSLNIADLVGTEAAAETDAKVSPGGTAPLHLDVAAIAVRNAKLTWRDETSGKTTTLSDLALTTGRLRGDRDSASYQVETLAFSTHGTTGAGGADRFEASLAAPLIRITDGGFVGDSLQLAATLTGKVRSVTARLGLDKIDGSANAVRIGRLTIDLDAHAGDARVKGKLESPVALDSKARIVALEKLSGALEISSPALPMKQLRLPLAGSLRADLAKQTASLALDTRFDESTVALRLSVPKFAPLALAFDLGIDRLDVDKYLPAASASNEAPTGAGGGAGGEAKIDLSALQGHDIRGSLRIGQLQAKRIKLAKLDARIALAGGRLEFAPFDAELYGGTLSGSLGANANGNSIIAKQTLSNVAIAPLLTDAMGKAPLEGRGTVNIDISTRGGTVSALKKALAGSAALSLKDGAVKGINLAKSLRDIKTKLGAKQGSTAAANGADKTDFSELSASFRIASGVAHNDDLAMKSPFLRLGGAGDIDLGNERIDYLAKVSVVNTSGGQEGKDLEHLKGVTVPVRLTGPFSQLSYKLELGSLVQEAAKAKVEEKKQELKTKAEEKLKDKLKGLFRK